MSTSDRLLVEAEELALFTPALREKIAGPIDFRLSAGECLVVRGPNGSGKTTLLKALMGQHKSFRGRLALHLPSTKVGVLPQLSNMRFHIPLTLADVLSISQPETPEHATLERAEKLGLLEKESFALDWNSASGGERQRTLLTRVFLPAPELLILDEPGNHLDRKSREKLARALNSYLQEAPDKRAILLVTHEDEIYRELPHREFHLAEQLA